MSFSSSAESAPCCAEHGRGYVRISLDDVQCFGNEKYLDECLHSAIGDNNCSHSQDAGVKCLGVCVSYKLAISAHTGFDLKLNIIGGMFACMYVKFWLGVCVCVCVCVRLMHYKLQMTAKSVSVHSPDKITLEPQWDRFTHHH